MGGARAAVMMRRSAASVARHAFGIAAVVALSAAPSACRDDAGAQGGARRWALAWFTERDVAVEVSLERDGAGKTWLAGRFTPTRAGYHLYGKDLPKEGIRGIGRPTLLEIAGAAGMQPAGAVEADRVPETLKVDLLGLQFPVYPAGPVTLRRPVAFARPGATTADLSVTYMACTEGTCLAPAIDKRFTVTIPDAATR